MKRIVCWFLLLLLSVSLVACKDGVKDPVEGKLDIEPDMLGPLFRITAPASVSEPSTRYYATESGIAYVTRTEKGYMGGYFMLPDLISNEAIFTCSSEPSAIFDLGEEQAAVFADGKLILLSLEEGTSTSYELNGKMQFTDIILGADGAFYYETEDYILTADLAFDTDFKELVVTERVVMQKDKIEGYTGMLAVSADGERLYYTYDDGSVRGLAYFGIGYRAERLGENPIAYRSVIRVSGTTKVLFTSGVSSGKVQYTYVDLDAAKVHVVSVAAGGEYASVTVNRAGTHLVGYLKDGDGLGGYLDLWELSSAKRLKHYELAELKINLSLCATTSAKYLVVGQFDEGAAYEDSGGETVTAIEVGK